MAARTNRAKELLESVLAGLENQSVTTVSLLSKCKEISELLNLGHDASWIDSELMGYPPYDPSTLVSAKDETFPAYRFVNVPSNAKSQVMSPIVGRAVIVDFPLTAPFCVTFACGLLETAQRPITLSYDSRFKVPARAREYLVPGQEEVYATCSGQLSVDVMRAIVHAIRGRIALFAAANYSALSFGNSAASIMDATRNLLADRLQKLHPPTLDFINETLDKQEKSTDPLEWRDVLENTRTILRRLTGVLMKKPMVPDGGSMPDEGETTKKTKMILDWAKTRLGNDHDTEVRHINKSLDALVTQESSLIDLINKPMHKEVTDVTKGDVDRLVLGTLVWIADLIAILDKAGYDWEKA